MKTVLFIPGSWYLSLERFSEIGRILGNDTKRVLIETGDPVYINSRNDQFDMSWFADNFDNTHFLEFPIIGSKSIFSLLSIYRYQQNFNKLIEFYRPDLIITTGDRNNFFLMLRKSCPRVPIVIFQGGLLHTKYYFDQNGFSSNFCQNSSKKKWFDHLKRFNSISGIAFLKKVRKIIYNMFGIAPLTGNSSIGWGLLDEKSHLFLWGPKTEALFKHHRKRNYCVGNPLTDDLYNKYQSNKLDKKLLKHIGCDETKKTILLSAECLLGNQYSVDILRFYKDIIKDSAAFNFIIKVHPRDKLSNFDMFLEDSHVLIIKDDYNFISLLHISDLNISNYSATSMEAIIFGIPVILLPQKLHGSAALEYWFGSDLFVKPINAESCSVFIKDALNDVRLKKFRFERENFLHDMFSKHIGNSKAAVKSQLEKLLYE